MNKKILIGIGILVAITVLIGVYVIYVHVLTPTKEQLMEKYHEFRIQYREKITQGYDVTEAKYFARKAKQAFDRKDYKTADELLEKAFEALEKAEIITLVPSWQVTESNSWMRDPITVHDFVPLGVVIKERPDHSLVLPGPKWRASNWVVFGKGTTPDGEHTITIHSSINIGGGTVRIIFDDQRIFHGLKGLYYDAQGKYFPYPTVHTNPNADYVNAIAYDEATRTWYYRLLDTRTSPSTVILDVVGKARSVPLWIGKPEGPYVIHGVYPNTQGVDCWGGYLDFGNMTATFTDPETNETYNFSGTVFNDREYHRACIGTPGGGPLSFTGLSLHKTEGEVIDLLVLQAVNPLPEELKERYQFPPFEHFGRINFVTRGEDYTFDNYKYSDDGGLQPSKYYLVGEFEGGTVNLTGEAFDFWGSGGSETWHQVTGTWWDSDGKYTWGRSFIRWSGTITLHGETIKIEEVFGWREGTQFEP